MKSVLLTDLSGLRYSVPMECVLISLPPDDPDSIEARIATVFMPADIQQRFDISLTEYERFKELATPEIIEFTTTANFTITGSVRHFLFTTRPVHPKQFDIVKVLVPMNPKIQFEILLSEFHRCTSLIQKRAAFTDS